MSYVTIPDATEHHNVRISAMDDVGYLLAALSILIIFTAHEYHSLVNYLYSALCLLFLVKTCCLETARSLLKKVPVSYSFYSFLVIVSMRGKSFHLVFPNRKGQSLRTTLQTLISKIGCMHCGT